MKCKEFELKVFDYIDGTLNQKQIDAFETHADTCEQCKKVLNDLRKTVGLLNTVRNIDLPPSFHENLKKSLHDLNKPESDRNVTVEEIQDVEQKIVEFKHKEKTKKPVGRRIVQTVATMAACVLIVFGVIVSGDRLLQNHFTKNMEDTGEMLSIKSLEDKGDVPDYAGGIKGETKVETEGEQKTPEDRISLMANLERGSDESFYFQKCYKINVITEKQPETTKEIKDLVIKYNGKYEQENYSTANDGDVYLIFSVPANSYSALLEDIWALKNNGLIQGFIENEVSVINYEYDIKLIENRIEELKDNLEELNEKQSEKSELIKEKEEELIALNLKLEDITVELQYTNVTFEISGQ